jgi:hypothetical protein
MHDEAECKKFRASASFRFVRPFSLLAEITNNESPGAI